MIKEIPYPGATKADRRRSLDLYLPAKSERRPPMMIFVHGGFWVLSDDDYKIGPYQPVIVIGLDDEKNLFRLGIFYRAQREYSWNSSAQPAMMARPLGAFIHCLKEPPAELAVQASQFALTKQFSPSC